MTTHAVTTEGERPMPDAQDTEQGTSDRRVPGVIGVLGACVACCLPMLVLVGAVSVGAAVAGVVGLGVVVAVVGTALVLVPRMRR